VPPVKTRLPPRLVVPLLAAILVPLVAFLFAERALRELESAQGATAAALAAPVAAEQVVGLVATADAALREYFEGGREAALKVYGDAVVEAERRVPALGQSDAATDRFKKLAARKLDDLAGAVELFKQGARTPAFEALVTSPVRMAELRAAARAVAEEAPRLAAASAESGTARIRNARLATGLIAAFSVALVFIVGMFARREVIEREGRAQEMLEDRNRLERAVESRTAEISELSNHLQQISEAERAKLARDIHDELGSLLVAGKMDAAWVQNRVRGADAQAAKKLQGLLGVLDQAIEIKRRVTEELHPTLLDNLGLGAALQWHVKEVCGRAGLVPDVKVPAQEIELPDQVSVALFRIVQEALTNTVKYARARKVTVALSRSPAGVALVVADDGVGLPPPAERREAAHGLLGMRERVRALRGELVIRSEPNAGTSIEVFVPTAAGRENGHLVPPSRPGD
jgi:signal transduction histidine kinase